jgi:murein DD-endopeptidase MepM/ murein hydrolase activator NlpD
VKDPTDFDVALKQVNEQISLWYDSENVNFSQDIVIKESTTFDAENISDTDECISIIYESGIDLRVEGAVLIIDGQEFAYTLSYEEANNVIEILEDKYLDNADSSETVVSSVILEDYSIVEKEFEYPLATAAEEIVEAILDGTEGVVEYTVQDGDNSWDIATNRGMTVRELEDANPDSDLDNLHSGDVINLTAVEPALTVETITEQTYIEEIDFDVVYQEDDSLYIGEQRLLTEGVKGTEEVEATTTYINGTEYESEVISTTTLTEPQTQVILTGTKEWTTGYSLNSSNTLPAPYADMFIIPSSGLITAIHKSGSHDGGCAVDIAGNTGTGIYAAADGVVTLAEYYGGYGLAIIIDHGNGYSTIYGHCSSIDVEVGQTVSQGDYIAGQGSTGNSTGTHLHFAIRINETPQVITNYFDGLYMGGYVSAGN